MNSVIAEALIAAFARKMPEEAEKPCLCREGLTYDKNNVTCQKCYGALQLKKSVYAAAVKAGRVDILVSLLADDMQAGDNDDYDRETDA